MKSKKWIYIAILVIFFAAIISVPLGINGSKRLHAEKIQVGNGEKEVKIAVIGDLHYPAAGVALQTILQKTKEFSPSLIAFTGDIIDSATTRENILELEPFIRSLSAVAPIYAVLGNHETINDNLKVYRLLLARCGALLLENEAEEVIINGKKIVIAGLSDNYGLTKENMPTLEGMEKNAPILLLAHRPGRWKEYLRSYPDYQPYLTLSGHNHGGQIKILGVGLLSPGGFFPKYYDGKYYDKKDDAYLVVTRGLGDSDLPYRYCNRYHLPLITVKL